MTRTVVRVNGLTKRYGTFTAVDAVDFTLEENRIYGLLGRNGAGKTTVMQMLTGQIFPSDGELEVFGRTPAEHADVLRRLCFIGESQRYPDAFNASHVMKAAPWFFENWDAEFAERLVHDFRLPLKRYIKKLSRGQLSAVGVIVGGANLLEHLLVIDQGRILLDRDADEVRGSATTVAGGRAAVESFVADRPVIGREGLGGLASVTIDGRLDQADRLRAAELGLELAPVSLQQLIVHMTGADLRADSTEQEVAA